MIYLPPPQPILNKDIRISGDVEVHPTASLAQGVILQAASESRIVIGADVCIGMGVIINACQGSVEIGDGAILGAGVLIIGESKIGNNSCIGTSTTIFRHNIAPMAVIEPGSILGDVSRPAASTPEQSESEQSESEQSESEQSESEQSESEQSESEQSKNIDHQPPPPADKKNQNSKGFARNNAPAKKPEPSTVKNINPPQNSTTIPQVETAAEYPVAKSKVPVVGQVYINELLITLFPHQKGSDSSSSK